MSLADPAAFAAFQATPSEGALEPRTSFCAEFRLESDPALGLAGGWTSPAGRVLELSARPDTEGAWLALHLALDLADLSQTRFLGIAARAAAPDRMSIRACLRSGREGGFHDLFLPLDWHVDGQVATHHDILHLPSQPALPHHAPWRQLVLFLPCRALDLHLHDLAVVRA